MADKGCRREVYRRKDKLWAWRLVGDNGSDIIATDGGQGYHTKDYCITMMRKVTGGDYAECDKSIEA